MAQKSKKAAPAKAPARKPAPVKVAAKKPVLKKPLPPKQKPAVSKTAKPAAKIVKPAPKKPLAAAKKPVSKPAPKKAKPVKPAPKKAVAPKKVSSVQSAKPVVPKKAPAKLPVRASKPTKPAPKPALKKAPVATPPKKPTPTAPAPKKNAPPAPQVKGGKVKPPSSEFLRKQRQRLLDLKDMLLDSMSGVGRDSLRSRAEGSEASAFGMHTADAGSDAYDRDFALSLLSQERDSLFEIDAALKKIGDGTYGVCEMSGQAIPHNRLEALPFARYTVQCQAELEKNNRLTRVRQPVTSLFGLGEDSETESEEEESPVDTKD
jgi:RNA polymerase-binding transcription factor DksA